MIYSLEFSEFGILWQHFVDKNKWGKKPPWLIIKEITGVLMSAERRLLNFELILQTFYLKGFGIWVSIY